MGELGKGPGTPPPLWGPRFVGVNRALEGIQVLLRHRLLSQPGGFEGVVAGVVLTATRDLSVPNREDVRESLIEFETAVPGASAESLNHRPTLWGSL